jgi:hypothetical protein
MIRPASQSAVLLSDLNLLINRAGHDVWARNGEDQLSVLDILLCEQASALSFDILAMAREMAVERASRFEIESE